MRRKDREICDFNEKTAIIKQSKVCRLGLVDQGFPYIVPLNYGFAIENQEVILYFHSAKQGRKIDILTNNPNVCVEIDCEHQLVEGAVACHYGYAYKSIIGFGMATFIKDNQEKKKALDYLMQHQTNQQKTFEYIPQHLENILVFKVVLSNFTAKSREIPSR